MWSHYITAAQAKVTGVFTLTIEVATNGIHFQCLCLHITAFGGASQLKSIQKHV